MPVVVNELVTKYTLRDDGYVSGSRRIARATEETTAAMDRQGRISRKVQSNVDRDRLLYESVTAGRISPFLAGSARADARYQIRMRRLEQVRAGRAAQAAGGEDGHAIDYNLMTGVKRGPASRELSALAAGIGASELSTILRGGAIGLGFYAAGEVVSEIGPLKKAISTVSGLLKVFGMTLNTVIAGDQGKLQDISDLFADRFNSKAAWQEGLRQRLSAAVLARQKEDSRQLQERLQSQRDFAEEERKRKDSFWQGQGRLERIRSARNAYEDSVRDAKDPALQFWRAKQKAFEESMRPKEFKKPLDRRPDIGRVLFGGGDQAALGIDPYELNAIAHGRGRSPSRIASGDGGIDRALEALATAIHKAQAKATYGVLRDMARSGARS